MAIVIAFPELNDLERALAPVFLMIDHFLYQFSAFSEKMKKIYRQEVLFFCKMHHRIPFSLALHSSVRRFQIPFEKRCENVGKIRNYLRSSFTSLK